MARELHPCSEHNIGWAKPLLVCTSLGRKRSQTVGLRSGFTRIRPRSEAGIHSGPLGHQAAQKHVQAEARGTHSLMTHSQATGNAQLGPETLLAIEQENLGLARSRPSPPDSECINGPPQPQTPQKYGGQCKGNQTPVTNGGHEPTYPTRYRR